MSKTLARASLAALAAAALAACTVTPPGAPPIATTTATDADTDTDTAATSSDSWLQGSVEQRLDTVADQLRGFGVTMLEVDHRYRELYFAGQDGNWDYAGYQIEEIREALASGVQRRPRRAASAARLEPALDTVKAAVSARDRTAFGQAFTTLTASCNACHRVEKAAFIQVAAPLQRVSSVQPAAQGGQPR